MQAYDPRVHDPRVRDGFWRALLQSILVRFEKPNQLWNEEPKDSKTGLLLKIEPEWIAGDPSEKFMEIKFERLKKYISIGKS